MNDSSQPFNSAEPTKMQLAHPSELCDLEKTAFPLWALVSHLWSERLDEIISKAPCASKMPNSLNKRVVPSA